MPLFLGPILARILASQLGKAAAGAAAKATSHIGSLLSRQAGSAASSIPQAAASAPPPQGVARVIGRGSNFGHILSGRMTAAQAVANQKPQLAPVQLVSSLMGRGGAGAGQQPQQPPTHGAMGGLVSGAMKGAAALATANPLLAATALIGTFAAITAAGKNLAEGQVEAQRVLTRFNGSIASAYALLDRGEILRQRASGGRTADSTKSVVDAVNDMRDQLQPLKDVATNIFNTLGKWGATVVAKLAQVLDKIGQGLGILDAIDDKKRKELDIDKCGLAESIRDLAKHYRAKNTPGPNKKDQQKP